MLLLRDSRFIHYSFKQLVRNGVHIGLQSTILHSSMLKFVLPVKYLNFQIFNLNFTMYALRLISNFIVSLVSKRRTSLVVNSVSLLDDFLFDFFSGYNQPVSRGLWVPGRLTNFRKVRLNSVRYYYLHKIIIRSFARTESLGLSNMQMRNLMNRVFNPIRYKRSVSRHVMNLTKMPRFCFINDSTINSVAVNECFILKLPSIATVDSGADNAFKVTYPIPGNVVSLSSMLLYFTIFKSAVIRGLYKERYLFLKAALNFRQTFYQIFGYFPVISSTAVPYRKSPPKFSNFFYKLNSGLKNLAYLRASAKYFEQRLTNIKGYMPIFDLVRVASKTVNFQKSPLITNFTRTFNNNIQFSSTQLAALFNSSTITATLPTIFKDFKFNPDLSLNDLVLSLLYKNWLTSQWFNIQKKLSSTLERFIFIPRSTLLHGVYLTSLENDQKNPFEIFWSKLKPSMLKFNKLLSIYRSDLSSYSWASRSYNVSNLSSFYSRLINKVFATHYKLRKVSISNLESKVTKNLLAPSFLEYIRAVPKLHLKRLKFRPSPSFRTSERLPNYTKMFLQRRRKQRRW